MIIARVGSVFAVAALAVCAAQPASADSTVTLGKPAPEMVRIAAYYAPHGTFLLAGGQAQMIRFSSKDAHAVCLMQHDPAFPLPQAQRRVVPLRVSWAVEGDRKSRTLYPGECAHLQAGFVMLSPGGALDGDEALQATVRRENGADLPGS